MILGRRRDSGQRRPSAGASLGMHLLGVASMLFAFAACGKGSPQFEGQTPPLDPVAVYGECAYCHDPIATQLVDTGGHGSLDLKCQACHTQLLSLPGPGHESVPQCADCHADQQTHHDPAAGTPQQCLVCHTPHGSPNILLVNLAIQTPDGDLAPIHFTNTMGKADGSFASVSHPGTGVCEVCHTTTQFYNNTGTGAPHFTFSCYTCHPHTNAFDPQ